MMATGPEEASPIFRLECVCGVSLSTKGGWEPTVTAVLVIVLIFSLHPLSIY